MESKWGDVNVIPYSLHPQPVVAKPPTYANIATRHMPTDKFQNTMNTTRSLSRSKSNVEFLVSNHEQDDPRSSILARPSSSDSLVALSSGLTVDFSSDLRLTNYKEALADSPLAPAQPQKSKDNEFISMKTDKVFDSVINSKSGEKNSPNFSETVAQHNGWIPQSIGDKQALKEEMTSKTTTVSIF